MTSLPTALVEETICPEHVVAVAEDDGTKTLLLYVGRHDAGYIMLKRVLLQPEHARGLIGEPEPEPDPEPELEPAPEQLRLLTEESGACRTCESPIMPSGWCQAGHSPTEAL